MESRAQEQSQHIQNQRATEQQAFAIARLQQERERLIQRLREIDQTLLALQSPSQPSQDGQPAPAANPAGDSLAAQLARIDQELCALDSNKGAAPKHGYTGTERRATPRPTLVARPLEGMPDPGSSSDFGPVRGAILERARRILQPGNDDRA